VFVAPGHEPESEELWLDAAVVQKHASAAQVNDCAEFRARGWLTSARDAL